MWDNKREQTSDLAALLNDLKKSLIKASAIFYHESME